MSQHHPVRRCAFVLAAAVFALTAGTATAAAPPHHFAIGGGTAVGFGVTKHFAFAADQRSAITFAANGYAAETQDDPTGVFGDFRLAGPVKCLRVVGDHAVIGITIQYATGTAAGHEGEAFYLVANDGGATSTPDLFDNTGYTGTTTVDCSYEQFPLEVVTQGNIIIR